MITFTNIIDEHGYAVEVELEEVYDRMDSEDCENMIEWLTSDGLIESDNLNNTLQNEDFNSKLDNLKDVYYSITPKDEAVLNSILDKYL